MRDITLLGYLAIFLGAVSLTLVLVPVALRLAVRRQLLDVPGGHKGHDAPVPYLGGAAIAVAFSVAVLVAALVRPPEGGLVELAFVLVLAVGVALVGLLDDLRGLSVGTRLAVVVVAGLVLGVVGVRVSLPVPDLVNLALTVVWVVGITHAFNLLDNMDGLSAGVAAIAAATFGLVAALQGQFLVAALSVALTACALTFLVHNFHPARIYMGDAGSLFLGFLLAVLGIKVTVPTDPVIAAFVPILTLGVAILDTTLVTVDRVRRGQSPFQGGRDHVSHRLVLLGLPVRTAVVLVYAGAVGLGWLAVIMSRLEDRVTAQLLLAFGLVVLAACGVVLGRVHPGPDGLGTADRSSTPASRRTGRSRWLPLPRGLVTPLGHRRPGSDLVVGLQNRGRGSQGASKGRSLTSL
jgi:UDP-GlcNAc:undecaprenyl-phosphate/decaprenyl-phosphate GlcNAc-1-phosphate transferase